MNDEPNLPPIAPQEEAEPKKKMWPWILLQFVPSLAVPVFFLTVGSRINVSPQPVCVVVFAYGYILSFLFFRSRGKSVPASLFISLGNALVVFAANAIVVTGIVF